MLHRRHLLQLVAGGGVALAGRGEARRVSADTPRLPEPDDARRTWARLVADLSGRPVFFYTHGNVWGFKPQADELTVEQFARRIYGYSGVAARKLVRGSKGALTLVQKSWAFYRDPDSDAITDQIPNPYTGRTDLARPLSGPAFSKPLSALGEAGRPFGMRLRRMGSIAVVEMSALARFKSPDIDWYKLEANLEDFVCAAADLDSHSPHVPSRYSQSLVAEWQTWTGMHGIPGHILFKGNGVPSRSLDMVPLDQLEAIERFFPGTLAEARLQFG